MFTQHDRAGVKRIEAPVGDAGWSSLRVIADGDFVVQHGVRGGSWRGGGTPR